MTDHITINLDTEDRGVAVSIEITDARTWLVEIMKALTNEPVEIRDVGRLLADAFDEALADLDPSDQEELLQVFVPKVTDMLDNFLIDDDE